MSQEENVAANALVKPFSVSSEDEGGATVISVAGELDLSTAPQLEEHLRVAGVEDQIPTKPTRQEAIETLLT